MNKLVQIFLKFIKIMRENGSDYGKTRLELVKAGFLPSEIDAALEWYFGESVSAGGDRPAAPGFCEPSGRGFRFFTLAEERLLSLEARGYLTELLASGTISYGEIESVIETLADYMVEDASVEDIDDIMVGFRSIGVSGREGAEDCVEFKVRYIQ